MPRILRPFLKFIVSFLKIQLSFRSGRYVLDSWNLDLGLVSPCSTLDVRFEFVSFLISFTCHSFADHFSLAYAIPSHPLTSVPWRSSPLVHHACMHGHGGIIDLKSAGGTQDDKK